MLSALHPSSLQTSHNDKHYTEAALGRTLAKNGS
jgi:hypothetical protein